MNRRVLLIDSDLGFRDTLAHELARYRVIVLTEPDADRALALALADAPALIILDIEEADKKAGYRVFEKCKKGALRRVPIILVTATVPAESFAGHRRLKVHADEYIDKRTMTTHELVGKIDGLVALGDADDELAIPVEDEIPMEIADGDVVLDEIAEQEPATASEPAVASDDAGDDFDDAHEARTVGPNDGLSIDDVVEAETDAAFAALVGDADPGGPTVLGEVPPVDGDAAAEVPPGAVPPGAVPEPIPHAILHPERQLAGDLDDVSVIPRPIHDGRGRGTTPPPLLPGSVPGVIADERDALSVPLRAATANPAEAGEHDEPVLLHAPVPRRDTAPPVPPDEETVAQAAADLPPIGHAGVTLESQPAIPIDDDEMLALDEDVPVEVEPGEPEPPPAPEPVPMAVPSSSAHAGSGSHPTIDLGLDVVAAEARNEQSGVYDRRALRKIGELERQLAQLKVELERARTAGEAAAKGGGREAQFLNLRESLLAKDKELGQTRADLAARDRELGDARERVRVAQHAKSTLEAKNAELEQRLFDDSSKSSELTASAKAAAAQVTTLRTQLDAATKVHTTAEAARAQAERELAAERATRAASASEAERALRAEREQLVARHQAELAAARTAAETERATAIARLRDELEAAHGAALDEAIEEVRRANAAEHQEAVAALEHAHAGDMVELKADHAGAQTAMRRELDAEIDQLRAELDRLRAALAAAESTHVDALAAATATHAAALEALAATHRGELTQRDQLIEAVRDELAEEREAERAEADARHAEATAALRAAAEAAAAQHVRALADARADAERADAAHAAERDRLAAAAESAEGAQRDAHRAALADAEARHEQELAKLHADRESVADAAKRSAEAHRAALAEVEARHADEIAQLNDAASRELAEARGAALTAKRAADETAARAQAEREAAEAAHAQARDELEAKHDRALALANGEFLKQKSVADAEHARARAALQAETTAARDALVAEHARVLKEVTAERDELKRGLSSARDALRRSEGELGSAVQSIADRNAELRTHAAAIADRDTRIGELRKEIEALETENANYQDQVLRAYQKIKQDEAMVTRAKKAMAIALTVLDAEPPSGD